MGPYDGAPEDRSEVDAQTVGGKERVHARRRNGSRQDLQFHIDSHYPQNHFWAEVGALPDRVPFYRSNSMVRRNKNVEQPRLT